jgi:hypothetical protein
MRASSLTKFMKGPKVNDNDSGTESAPGPSIELLDFNDNQFAKIIALMSRGKLQKKPKEYPAFKRPAIMESKFNPAIANTHIASAFDAHNTETEHHWKNCGGQRFGSEARHFEAPGRTEGPTGAARDIPHMTEQPVQVFGRHRIMDPFARAKLYGRFQNRYGTSKPKYVSCSITTV